MSTTMGSSDVIPPRKGVCRVELFIILLVVDGGPHLEVKEDQCAFLSREPMRGVRHDNVRNRAEFPPQGRICSRN